MRADAVPRATYRLQLSPDFPFKAAAAVVPYLERLGVSHVYCSPYLKARPGSSHGYDITDHNAVNPALGDDERSGEEAFQHFAATLRDHNMSHILDFVPNHMGVGGQDNAWWLDVLEWGQGSPYAAYFDIDWAPADPTLKGKVLLPFLGGPYGDVLAGGELRAAFSAPEGAIDVWFYEHRFPIALRDYARLLTPGLRALQRSRGREDESVRALDDLLQAFQALRRRGGSGRARAAQRQRGLELKRQLASLAAGDVGLTAALDDAIERLNGTPGDLDSWEPLHRLLERQAYRPSWWRVAGDAVNYRRFFDINDLAGLRMENASLFRESHQLILRLIQEGTLAGLRLDHVDGLYDPAGYARRLQEEASKAQGRPPWRRGRAQDLYVVVEKILEPEESLRPDWPVAGTTGYDFLNDILGVLMEPAAEDRLTRIYRGATGDTNSFDGILAAAKRRVTGSELAGELEVLATDLWHIAMAAPQSRDYTLNGLRDALREIIVHFPVYRTYVTGRGANQLDRAPIDAAVTAAQRQRNDLEPRLLGFIRDAMTGDLSRGDPKRYHRAAILRFAMKLQQLTGPVMAKGFEDTALYRYPRLLALNEVGGNPRRLGLSPETFHARNQERARLWPAGMLTTATHDTKRGEDVRARLAVLSEWPGVWQAQLRGWLSASEAFRTTLGGGQIAPDDIDRYLILQTMIGTWPLSPDPLEDGEAMATYRQRLIDYTTKALREARRHTEWASPRGDYEEAAHGFIDSVLADTRPDGVLAQMAGLRQDVAWHGMLNALTQTTAKLLSPGVPDIYQGCETWDLSLVDPDNRRAVDYAAREALLGQLEAAYAETWPEPAWFQALLRAWRDGGAKMLLVWRLLSLRRHWPAFFRTADYRPLSPEGTQAGHVLAFARRQRGQTVLTILPRLTASLVEGGMLPLGGAVWADTRVQPGSRQPLIDIITGRRVTPGRRGIALAEALSDFPVAVLASENALGEGLATGGATGGAIGAGPDPTASP